MRRIDIHKIKGFTLIEVMVSSSIFIIVMLMVSGAVASIVSANRKSINLRSSLDNLDVTLQDLTRTIGFGKNYHCSNTQPPSLTLPLDCPGGSSSITVQGQDGSFYTYYLSGNKIIKSTLGGASADLTTPDMSITALNFVVSGSQPLSAGFSCAASDCYQPRVLITISGTVGNDKNKSSFNLETLVTQRLFDFQ